MKSNKKHGAGISLAIGAVVLGTLTGCVGYVDGPRPPYVEAGITVQPDYVYYPGYEVYYSGNTHQYVYRDGRTWVTRSAPPRVSAEVLFAAPSVRLDFHDSPANHHAVIARQYPRQWSGPGPGRGNEHPKERRDDH